MTYDRCDAPHELTADYIDGLHSAVMDAFNRHFAGFEQGAGAQAAYRRARKTIDTDTTIPLFGVLEAFKAAVAAYPDARKWEAFECEAAAKIAPFCVTVQFTG